MTAYAGGEPTMRPFPFLTLTLLLSLFLRWYERRLGKD